jgi:hypothetical protein
VAVRSQAYVWGRSIAGTAASNPADGMNVASVMFVVCCVGSGLWDELTTHSEEFYRLCAYVCVCVCDCVRAISLKNEAVLARVELMHHKKKSTDITSDQITLCSRLFKMHWFFSLTQF